MRKTVNLRDVLFLSIVTVALNGSVFAAEENKGYLDSSYGRIFVAGVPGKIGQQVFNGFVSEFGKRAAGGLLEQAQGYYAKVKDEIDGIGKSSGTESKAEALAGCKLMDFKVKANGGVNGLIFCQKSGYTLRNIAKVDGTWDADVLEPTADQRSRHYQKKTGYMGYDATDDKLRSIQAVRENDSYPWMCVMTDAYGGGSGGRPVRLKEEFDKETVQIWANQKNHNSTNGTLTVWFSCKPM